ncbi:Gfo/Idh/MocA family oxidoreductase [Aquimarina sp. ERC-38]|uniref:Gfo/Idh/MocA family protein n=1 Tax=Aquimarina sp. ERC-38 TaxID=2949996 RepID=UPI0022452B9D|nr:Gfo/Idh/MocA family oxidoreductase [Aquimarina sp. ERC-38]UZO80369.1 Gfo/Idh/MocA family oxidoreductase [Aquimarina sp. ERC-38]
MAVVSGATLITPTLLSSVKLKTKLTNDKPLRIALCGLGKYAKILAEALASTHNCKLMGLITGTPEKEVSWGEKYNIPSKNIYNYKNFDTIKDNKDIDLVYVVLPNSMHKEFTIRAANSGKHVIVEKPMALNAPDCLEMIAACKKNKVQLAVGYRLHFDPYYHEMKRLASTDELGPVRYIDSGFGYRIKGWAKDAWHLKKELSGGGPLPNIGIYCIQNNRYILGEEPKYVTAQFGPIQRPEYFKEVEESITWQLEFPGGAITNSASSYSYNVNKIYASGDKGFIELDPAHNYAPLKGKSSQGIMNFPLINQQSEQMDGIAEYILRDEALPTHITGEEGYKDMVVIDAIYKSAKTGRKVEIKRA